MSPALILLAVAAARFVTVTLDSCDSLIDRLTSKVKRSPSTVMVPDSADVISTFASRMNSATA